MFVKKKKKKMMTGSWWTRFFRRGNKIHFYYVDYLLKGRLIESIYTIFIQFF